MSGASFAELASACNRYASSSSCFANDLDERMQYAMVFTHEDYAIRGCHEEYALTVGSKELTNAKWHKAVECVFLFTMISRRLNPKLTRVKKAEKITISLIRRCQNARIIIDAKINEIDF